MSARYLYTVRYRRTSWTYKKGRTFKDPRAAKRLIRKLLDQDPAYAPLDYLTLERQELGPTETVTVYIEEAAL